MCASNFSTFGVNQATLCGSNFKSIGFKSNGAAQLIHNFLSPTLLGFVVVYAEVQHVAKKVTLTIAVKNRLVS